MHLCLTVECISSGLHLSIFYLGLNPPPPPLHAHRKKSHPLHAKTQEYCVVRAVSPRTSSQEKPSPDVLSAHLVCLLFDDNFMVVLPPNVSHSI